MNPRPFRISSVTRWLLVVAGCVVLETAQPAFAAQAEDIAPPPAEESIIYPRGSGPATPPARPAEALPSGPGYFTVTVAFLLLAGGGWLLWKKKMPGPLAASGRKIQVEETRSMGNRQYLVIASCEGKRLLLGVTAGRIDVLAPLDPSSPASPEAP